MRTTCIALVFYTLAGVVAAQAPRHEMAPLKPEWNPVGPNLLPGAEIAVLQGDPAKPELFTVRLRMPKGYVVAPTITAQTSTLR